MQHGMAEAASRSEHVESRFPGWRYSLESGSQEAVIVRNRTRGGVFFCASAELGLGPTRGTTSGAKEAPARPLDNVLYPIDGRTVWISTRVKSSQICRWFEQAREQPRSRQTGSCGARCGTFVGLTRRGRHPSRHGQLPGWATFKANTEALAKDAVCRPFYMLQHRILRLS